MWAPPSYLSGCSQGVWRGEGGPVLARNYDYAPERLEGAILHTRWTGRGVIGVSDCVWGLLDGINDAGLAVSLAFGGRRAIGDGFGVPLIVRYLLETCDTTEQARVALRRLPYHLAHTLTIVDRVGDVVTAYLAPDREIELSSAAVATNHQGRIEWAEHAAATRTVEREQCLMRLLARKSTTRSSSWTRSSVRRCTSPTMRAGWARSTPPPTTSARARRVPLARRFVAAELRRVRRGNEARGVGRRARSVM